MSRAMNRAMRPVKGKNYLPAAHISKRKPGYTAELTDNRKYRNKRQAEQEVD